MSERFRRPPLERDRPLRNWSTLFGSAATRVTAEGASAASAPGPAATASGAASLADTVGLGYRVIDEYLRQGQRFAETWSGVAAGGGRASDANADVRALLQQALELGLGFTGVWVEALSRMAARTEGAVPGGNDGGASGKAPVVPFASEPAAATPMANEPEQASEPAAPARESVQVNGVDLTVEVTCSRPTKTAVWLRPGASGALLVHALRSDASDHPPIHAVSVEPRASGDESGFVVRVAIGPQQPPGVYNALIIDALSNLPRGTLSVEVG